MKHRARTVLVAALLLAFASGVGGLAAAGVDQSRAGAAGSRVGGFTIESLSPLVKATPELFGPNCFLFLLTNTGSELDTFHLDGENLSPPTWAASVQVLGLVTYPYPAAHPLAAGESDTLCAELTPFHDGVGSYDFVIQSASDPDRGESFHLILYAGDAAVSAGEVSAAPAVGALHANYPNPFSRETWFHYDLLRSVQADLRVLDAAGRVVRVLEGGNKEPGRHAVRWDGTASDGRRVAAGTYFYQLIAGDIRSTRRMVVLR